MPFKKNSLSLTRAKSDEELKLSEVVIEESEMEQENKNLRTEKKRARPDLGISSRPSWQLSNRAEVILTTCTSFTSRSTSSHIHSQLFLSSHSFVR